MQDRSILIAGASFAGLATAYWMARNGYQVTIVEAAPSLRMGGTPVDIRGDTVDVVTRMGLLDAIVEKQIVTDMVEVWGEAGLIDRSVTAPSSSSGEVEYEIGRDVLTHLLFDLVRNDASILFDDKIVEMQESDRGVDVRLASGAFRSFDLVLGCDGLHSDVRRQWLGEEALYGHFLGAYGSVTIVPRLLIEPRSMAIYKSPGRSIILSAHGARTDIITLFSSSQPITYDRRSRSAKLALIADRFSGIGWRMPELLHEMAVADNLYFSELSQIRMPRWSKGRVGLVGDAAYCASPAAGRGGSLALDGAAALGEAFRVSGYNYDAAFNSYDAALRPFVEDVQATAVRFCAELTGGSLTRDHAAPTARRDIDHKVVRPLGSAL